MSVETVIDVLATVCAVSMALSQIPSIYRRYKAQDTGEYQILPVLVMFGNYLLWLIYSLFADMIFPLGVTSAINSMLGLSYSIVFVFSTRDRAKAIETFAIVLTVTLAFILYAVLAWNGYTNQSRDEAGSVFGYIVVTSMIIFYVSPLAKLRTVLRTKSAGSIPIAMCAVGALNNALWLTYAILTEDNFLIVPNVVCITFNTVQVLLYIKYNPKRTTNKPVYGAKDEIITVSIAVEGKQCPSPVQSPSFRALSSPVASSEHRV